MKLFLLVVFAAFLSIFCAQSSLAQAIGPSILWQKSLGGSQDDKAYSIAKAIDGGIVVVGSSLSNDGDVTGHHGSIDSTDGWIVKLAADGTVQWEKSIGGSGNDVFNKVVLTADGGYICVGTTSSNDGDVSGNHGLQDVWVVKLDAYGNITWQECLGGSSNDFGSDIVQTADSTYTLIGSTNSNDGNVSGNYGQQDAWVAGLNGMGTLRWQHCYGSTSTDYGYGIASLSNGEYLVGMQGYTDNGAFTGLGGGQSPNAYVFKINDTGQLVQGKWNGSEAYGVYGAAVLDSKHFYLLTGLQYCNSNTAFQVQQFDTSFNQVNSTDIFGYCGPSSYEYFGPTGGGTMTLLGSGGGVLAAATSNAQLSGFHGLYDGYVANFGANTWGKTYGGSGSDWFTGIVAINDYDFVVAGYSNSNDGDVSGNHGGLDFWVVRLSHFNTIRGTVYLDYNKNGVRDAGEPLVNNVLVQSSGSGIVSGSSTVNGVFNNIADTTGTFTTTVISSVPYYTAVPASHTSTFSAYDLSDSFSIAMQPVAGQRDYAVSLYPIDPARPGDSIRMGLLYMNEGTDTLTGRTVRLVKDHRLQYLSATPAATAVSGDTILWTIASLAPRDTGTITIYTKAMAPPTLSLGDTLLSTAWIDTTGDLNTANNTFALKQVVRSSFDPNGKTESNEGYVDSSDLAKGKDLQYTITFQNTGNDTAFNISIVDTLSSKLDVTSFEMVGASAPFQLTTRNGNILTWTFASIRLPDSTVNGPGSHGYIVYRIKPNAGIHKGDSILNGAGIYFDLNPAVPTDQQKTLVINTVINPPPAPVIAGLQSNYCINAGPQTVTISNMPQPQGLDSVSAWVDMVQTTVSAGGTFTVQPHALTSGTHAVTVIFSNLAGADTTVQHFAVDTAVTPVVRLSSSADTLTGSSPTSELHATAASGGGSSPLFTFATDNGFMHKLSGPGSADSVLVDTAMLVVGTNTIYVRMQTSDTCVTVQTATDSLTITRRASSTSGGGGDTAAAALGANPNPFRDQLNITGLLASDSYSIKLLNSQGMSVRSVQVSGVRQTVFYTGNMTTGIYLLRIYDATNGKVVRLVRLLAIGNN